MRLEKTRYAIDSIFGTRVCIAEVEAVSPAGILHELRVRTHGSGECDQISAGSIATTVSASPCNSIVGGRCFTFATVASGMPP